MLLLVAAIPIGIVFLTVAVTEAERAADLHGAHKPSGVRGGTSLLFGLAAVLGVAVIFFGTGREYAIFLFLVPGIPALAISAVLGAVFHLQLSGPSKFIAALTGLGVTILTVLACAALVALLAAPGVKEGMFVMAFGASMVLFPFGFPVLIIGVVAGIAANIMSNRQRPNE